MVHVAVTDFCHLGDLIVEATEAARASELRDLGGLRAVPSNAFSRKCWAWLRSFEDCYDELLESRNLTGVH